MKVASPTAKHRAYLLVVVDYNDGCCLSARLSTLQRQCDNDGLRVEFQKRGLPHTHILMRMASSMLSPHQIEAVESADWSKID